MLIFLIILKLVAIHLCQIYRILEWTQIKKYTNSNTNLKILGIKIDDIKNELKSSGEEIENLNEDELIKKYTSKYYQSELMLNYKISDSTLNKKDSEGIDLLYTVNPIVIDLYNSIVILPLINKLVHSNNTKLYSSFDYFTLSSHVSNSSSVEANNILMYIYNELIVLIMN